MRADKEFLCALCGIFSFESDADRNIITLAGDGAVSVEVEALEVTLQDVTRPYIAPSKARPTHPE